MLRSARKILTLYFWVSFCIPVFASESGVSTITFVKQNSKPTYFETNSDGLYGEIYSLLASGLAYKGVK